MALFDAELVAEYEDGDFLTSPREVLALKETSISSVTSHILYPPITTNLTPISRYVLSSLPTAISKWKLAAAPSIPSLTEQNEKDGRIPFTILQDDRIEIRFLNDSGSSDVITLPIPEDAFPHSRILSWSTDACLVAVGASDGSIRVLHARETGPFVPLFIIEGERSISTGQESLPSTQKHYNPLMNIAIVSFDFRGNSSLLKHSHSHELLAFSYNGSFRVYHIDLPALLGIESLVNNSILTATSSVSFWKKALSLTVQGTLEGLVSFSHSISLSQYFHTITCVSLDLRRRSLLIAGLSGMSLKGHRFARFKGESELQQIIEITLLHDKPFCEVIDAFGNLHPPLESPLRSSTQLEGALASLWDMLGDIGAHALCLVSKKPYINTDKIIINMSASSNTAGDVLALDLSGNIFLLSRVSGSRLNTWRSNDLIVARASLVKQVSVNNVKNPRVIDAKWWSSTSIAITFSDGFISVFDLGSMEDCVMAEEFSNAIYPTVLSLDEGKVLVLESMKVSTSSRKHSLSQVNVPNAIDFLISPPTFSLYGLSRLLAGLPIGPNQYNLIAFREVTPLECLRIKLAQREYGTALELCEQYALDVDEVHKSRWVNSDLGETSITDFLSRVKDREWALRDATSRIPKSPRNLRELLKYVVRYTDSISMEQLNEEFEQFLEGISGAEAPGNKLARDDNINVTTLCMLRMKALKYLDRLDTFEAIRDFIRDTQELFPSAFLKFRDRDIVDIAKMFSAEGNVTALELLFTRHKELMPFRFEVLRELPVTLNPSDFRITLPRFDSRSELEILPKPIPWRQPDWTEANPQVSEVLLSFELADEHLFKCGINSGKPFDNAASGEVLSAWYNDFIRRIERETGQTSLALSLTIIAQSPEFNIPGLERTHHWLQTLSDLNYVCERLDIGLSELGEMSNEEIIQYFLAGSVDDIFSFTRKIKCVVVPYLERSKRLLEASAYSAFDSYLVEVASINIEACSKVFEMSRDGITEEERIIASPSRLAEVMLRCAYVPEITGADLSILHSFIRSLPDTTSIRSIDLTERITNFETHVDTLDILTRYHVQSSMFSLLDAKNTSEKDQRLLLSRMIRYISDNADRCSRDKEWSTLYQDLQVVFGSNTFLDVTKDDAQKEFLRVALSSEKFNLVKGLMDKRSFSLSNSDIDEIVLTVARDLFDNAEYENTNNNLMKLSLACLTTVPVTPEIQAEIDFVNGSLLLLNTYAIVSPDATPPLPIQIRLAEDRLVLIANLISFFPKNRIPDRSLLVDIGQKLTQRTGAEIEVRVRGMVATWALNHGNIDLSLKICLEMIELSATKRMSDTTLTIEEEWRVALRVVLEAGHVISLGTRRELLTFCLEWCDSKSINEVLEAARVAELSQALKISTVDFDVDLASFDIKRLIESHNSKVKPESIPRDELSIHVFYARGKKSFDSDYFSEAIEELTKLELLTLSEGLECFKRFRSFQHSVEPDAEQEDELSRRDRIWLSIAHETFKKGDAGLAMMLLLDMNNDESAIGFLKSLFASRPHDLLAVYFCSLRVLEILLKRDEPETATSLDNQRPSHIIKSVEKLASKMSHLIEDGKLTEAEDSELKIPFLYIRNAYAFSARSQSDQYDKVLSKVRSHPEVDSGRFNTDESYRRDSIIRLASLAEEELPNFLDLTRICSKFGIQASVLAAERLSSLILSSKFDASKLESEFEQIKYLLDSQSLYSKIRSLHRRLIDDGSVSKLTCFYQIVISSLNLEQHLDSLSGLKERVKLIGWLSEHPNNIFNTWKLSDLFALSYSTDSASSLASRFKKEWEDTGGNVQTLRAIGATLKRLESVNYLHLFEEESELLDMGVEKADLAIAASLLYKSYVIAKVEEAEWEYSEEERIAEDLEEIEYLLSGMILEDLAACLNMCCVGENASAVPIDLRIKLIDASVEGKGSHSISFTEDFKKLRCHLELISDLSKLSDPVSGKRLYSERLQQFDLTYGEAPQEAAALCMRMVVAGASPYLVEKTCELVKGYHQNFSKTDSDLTEMFEPSKVYEQSVKCVLGFQISDLFTSVFRRGVESPIDALDRLVKAVVSHKGGIVEIPRPPPKSDDGWDSDGWGEDEPKEPTAEKDLVVAEVIDTVLTDILRENAASISPDVQLGIASILKKYFGKDVLDTRKLRGFKVRRILEALWDVEGTDDTCDTIEARKGLFSNIVPRTRLSEQCVGLAQILAEWSDLDTETELATDLRPMWKAIVRKSVVCNASKLLLYLCSSEALKDVFDDELNDFVLTELEKMEGPEASATLAKYALLSGMTDKAESVLRQFLESSQSSSDIHSLIYLLIVVHNLMDLVPPSMWPNIVNALTRLHSIDIEMSIAELLSLRPTEDPVELTKLRYAMLSGVHELHLRLTCHAVLALLEQNKISRAADLAIRTLGAPSSAVTGLSIRVPAIKNFLKRRLAASKLQNDEDPTVELRSRSSLQQLQGDPGVVERDAIVELLAVDALRVKNLQKSGVNLEERILDALRQLEELKQ